MAVVRACSRRMQRSHSSARIDAQKAHRQQLTIGAADPVLLPVSAEGLKEVDLRRASVHPAVSGRGVSASWRASSKGAGRANATTAQRTSTPHLALGLGGDRAGELVGRSVLGGNAARGCQKAEREERDARLYHASTLKEPCAEFDVSCTNLD